MPIIVLYSKLCTWFFLKLIYRINTLTFSRPKIREVYVHTVLYSLCTHSTVQFMYTQFCTGYVHKEYCKVIYTQAILLWNLFTSKTICFVTIHLTFLLKCRLFIPQLYGWSFLNKNNKYSYIFLIKCWIIHLHTNVETKYICVDILFSILNNLKIIFF